jgi:hypothetical protein
MDWRCNVAQAVEYLLCKCKALSSNPVSTKEKKKKSRTGGVAQVVTVYA